MCKSCASCGFRTALITLAVLEIILGFSAVLLSILTVFFTVNVYQECHNYIIDNELENYNTSCGDLYERQYTFSLTSQGIWAGCFIIISACCKLRFASNPTSETGNYSTGFAIVAFLMSITLTVMECIATVSCYNNEVDSLLLPSHFVMLLIGGILIFLTMLSLIISSCSNSGCCANNNHYRTIPDSGKQIPMSNLTPTSYSQQQLGSTGNFAASAAPGRSTALPGTVRRDLRSTSAVWQQDEYLRYQEGAL